MPNPVLQRQCWVDGAEPAAATLEQELFLVGIQFVPAVGGFGDLLVDQRAIARMVGEESKHIFDLFIG